MIAFTTPSLSHVLKDRQDVADKPISIGAAAIRRMYELVHEMDRVGRMLDSWHYQKLKV